MDEVNRILRFRVDLLGTSEDTKPLDTPNGSTYYEVDTSKFYILWEGEWIEQKGVNDLEIQYITDLGRINSEEYEDDIATYLNTLTTSGIYRFAWDNGEGFEYIVQVQTITSEEDESIIYINQHYWGTEEGPGSEYNRALTVEDGEVTEEETTSYMTFESASMAFASKTHVHFITAQASLSVWDYCTGNQISIKTDTPIIYTDNRTPKHHWLIETTSATTSPNNRFLRVTDLADASVIYQISGTYSGGVITWGSWYKFSGSVFNPS